MEYHFAALSDMTSAERGAALSAIADEAVRDEVASLLGYATGSETVTDVIAGAASQIETSAFRDQRIGAYKVVRRLGQGGQGTVFEAVRDDGSFHQRVAIKVVKWEMDSDAVRERFRQERQILAGLEHPHIARLLDGGETQDGAPYLVMEFIDGLPLTAACEGWNERRKLALFLDVASAVTFAHRNLIVHRDLKPANILVTKEGSCKLLDFGIAKLLDANAQRTMTAHQALTPDYASPEQVRAEPITTASDVYSLGVVLYEVLAGRRPYRLNTSTAAEMERTVCQEPPASPGLGNELDHILLMALRKEPERRYGSVQEFADDITRYLDNRPVTARPDTLVYRARKYARRHWAGLLAAFIALAGVGIGTGMAVYQARIAQQRFQQVRRLAHSFVFDYQDDLAKVQGNTAVREKMVRTALEYLDMLSKSAGSDLDLQAELAAAYRRVGDAQGFPAKPNLGHTDQAIASYRKAAGIYDDVAVRDPKYRAEASEFHAAFISLLTNTGDLAGAAEQAQAALRLAEQVAQEQPGNESAQIALARIWDLMGDIDDTVDNYPLATEKYRKAELISRKVLARWRDLSSLRAAEGAESRLASEEEAAGRLKESLAAFEEDQKLLEELLRLAPGDPGFRHGAMVLAQFRSQAYYDDLFPNLGDPAQSLLYARQAVQIARNEAAGDPNDAAAESSLAIMLYRLSLPLKISDPDGGVQAAEESVRLFDRQIASGKKSFLVNSRRVRALHRLAEALLFAGRAEAGAMAAKALAEERTLAAAEDKQNYVTARLPLALVTSAQAAEAAHDRKSAEAFLLEAEQTAEKVRAWNRAVVSNSIPLSEVQEAQAAYWKRAGDANKSQHWQEEVRRLWREFPDQNEYVKRQRAKFAANSDDVSKRN